MQSISISSKWEQVDPQQPLSSRKIQPAFLKCCSHSLAYQLKQKHRRKYASRAHAHKPTVVEECSCCCTSPPTKERHFRAAIKHTPLTVCPDVTQIWPYQTGEQFRTSSLDDRPADLWKCCFVSDLILEEVFYSSCDSFPSIPATCPYLITPIASHRPEESGIGSSY